MSGGTVYRALQDRFESIRQSEFERMQKKLRGLTDHDRAVVEAVTADIVQAIARVPGRALTDDAPAPALDAVVRLFALEA
jgi:glutamyl-tRNA reductase